MIPESKKDPYLRSISLYEAYDPKRIYNTSVGLTKEKAANQQVLILNRFIDRVITIHREKRYTVPMNAFYLIEELKDRVGEDPTIDYNKTIYKDFYG